MKKLLIVMLLCAAASFSASAQMGKFLDPGKYGMIDLNLIRFPMQKENYPATLTVKYGTGYIERGEDISTTLASARTLSYTGRLVHSSVTKEMVERCIRLAMQEAGINDLATFQKYVNDVNSQLHELKFSKWATAGEIAGAAALGATAGAALATGAVASVAGAAADALGAASTLIGSATYSGDAIGQMANVGGNVASAGGHINGWGTAGSAAGGIVGSLGMINTIAQKTKDAKAVHLNRAYALELLRIKAFYIYVNALLIKFAADAAATNWLVILDENQGTTSILFDQVECNVSTTSNSVLFKYANTGTPGSKPYEGLYSGFLEFTEEYDLSNYDRNYVSQSDVLAELTGAEDEYDVIKASEHFGVNYTDRIGVTTMDAVNARSTMNYFRWGFNDKKEYVKSLTYNSQPTTAVARYSFPVVLEVTKDDYSADAVVTPLEEGEYVPGFESWGPIEHTYTDVDFSIDKYMRIKVIPLDEDGKPLDVTLVGESKVWVENHMVYGDHHFGTKEAGGRLHGADELSGFPIEEVIGKDPRSGNLRILLIDDAMPETKPIPPGEIDRQLVEERRRFFESSYWNLTPQ